MDNRTLYSILEICTIRDKINAMIADVKSKVENTGSVEAAWQSIHDDVFTPVMSRRVFRLMEYLGLPFLYQHCNRQPISEILNFMTELSVAARRFELKYGDALYDPIFESSESLDAWIRTQDIELNRIWRTGNSIDYQTVYVVIRDRLLRVIEAHPQFKATSEIIDVVD